MTGLCCLVSSGCRAKARAALQALPRPLNKPFTPELGRESSARAILRAYVIEVESQV